MGMMDELKAELKKEFDETLDGKFKVVNKKLNTIEDKQDQILNELKKINKK